MHIYATTHNHTKHMPTSADADAKTSDSTKGMHAANGNSIAEYAPSSHCVVPVYLKVPVNVFTFTV